MTCAALQESPGKPFLDAVAEEVLGRLERRQASHSHLIMVAWAMATLGQLSAARFAEFLRAAPAATEPSHVGNHGRLLQIALYLQVRDGVGAFIEGKGAFWRAVGPVMVLLSGIMGEGRPGLYFLWYCGWMRG